MLGMRKFRLGNRLEARLNRSEDGSVVLTEEDEANLDAFEAKLREAISLLRQEVEAIRAGRLSVVGEIYDRKAMVMTWLEMRMPVIEPFLSHDAAKARDLHQLLRDLKTAVTEDSVLLERMAAAASTVVREIEKARERNGLGGLYDKSGEKLKDRSQVDRSIDRQY